MTSLTSKVIAGSKWMVILRLVNRASTTIVSIILARILAPEEFGLVAIGALSISLLQTLSEMGIKQALIVEGDVVNKSLLDSAWNIELMRGLLVSLLVFFSAQSVALFYEKPEAIDIIRCLGLIPLFRSVTSIRIIFLQKDLDFKKQFWYEISGLFGPIFISIPLAFIFQNAWAIVIGTVTADLIKVLLSYYVAPYKPKFYFKKSDFFKLFKFGKWIMAGSIISYFAMELDTYVAAKVFNTRLLGIYTLAFSVTNKPIIEIGKALNKVLFPTFSKMGGDIFRIRKAYVKSSFVLYLILFPAAVGLSLLASDFVIGILGAKWSDMIPVVQILSVGVVFRAIVLPSTGLFNGLRKPNIVLLMSLIRTLTMILAMLYFIENLDLKSLSYVVLISNIIVFLAFLFAIHKHVQIKIAVFFIYLLPLFLSILVMSAVILAIKQVLDQGLLRLLVSAILGSAMYLIVYITYSKYATKNDSIFNIRNLINGLKK